MNRGRSWCGSRTGSIRENGNACAIGSTLLVRNKRDNKNKNNNADDDLRNMLSNPFKKNNKTKYRKHGLFPPLFFVSVHKGTEVCNHGIIFQRKI